MKIDAERIPCDEGGRDWGDAVTSQGAPGLPVTPEVERRARNRFSPAAFKVAQPCRHLGFNLLAPKTVRIYFHHCKLPSL